MRKVFIIIFSLIASASVAQALPVVESVSSASFIVPSCPMCPGGEMTTTTTFVFTENWCSSPDSESAYEISIENKTIGFPGEEQTFVTIQQKQFLKDCHGPSYPRTFELSTKDLQSGERYILTNPSVIGNI